MAITKGYKIPQEGWYNAKIVGVQELENVVLKTNNGEITVDLFEISFNILEAIVKQRYFKNINEGTSFGNVIKAINYDEIPDEIFNLEEFLVGKNLDIRIAHNTSKKTGRTFANPVEYAAIDAFDEESSDGECIAAEFDAAWDEDQKFSLFPEEQEMDIERDDEITQENKYYKDDFFESESYEENEGIESEFDNYEQEDGYATQTFSRGRGFKPKKRRL